MLDLSLSGMAQTSDGRVLGADVRVRGMIHDSRQVEAGQLFVALPGAHSDGHDHVAAAASAGAAAALVGRALDHPLPQLLVDDVRLAMGRIAAAWRQRLDTTVVGITGSNGKTTVKEMITAILSAQAPTLATRGNYNNEIGVPLTLARLGPEHRYAVLEMGAGRSGDIRYLAELARPAIAVVTNAGPAHLETMGSIEGVAHTKGELFEALGADGMAVINADDRYCGLWRELARGRRQLSFGLSEGADVRGHQVNGTVRIDTPAGSVELQMSLPGRHNLMNALAAMAVACHLNWSLESAAHALMSMHSLPGRLNIRRHADGWRLIDDTYNANPASLYAGLQVLSELEGEPWLVLGDMAELGPDSDKLHREMGRTAADLGVRRLFTVGERSRAASAAFGRLARHFDDHDALLAALAAEIGNGVNCLIKGSRSMHMERIASGLMGEGD